MPRPPLPPPSSRSLSWRRRCSGHRSPGGSCDNVISQSDMQCSTMFSIESTILREGVNKCHLLGECAYYLLLDNYLFSYCHPLDWVIQGLPSSRYSITVITWYIFKDDKNSPTNCLKHCQTLPSTWLISIPVLYPGGGAAGGGGVSSQSWQDTGDKHFLQNHSSLIESVRRETKRPSLNCLIPFDPFHILIEITDIWNITRNVSIILKIGTLDL